MTWDERGRLWLALTLDYPNELQPEGKGRDKIVVCEDTTGDGVCDKVTEFADQLSIPTSLLNAYGGLIVHQAPHTLFLKDTTGDGRADVRQVLFTGWDTRDTHAGPSNLRYGFDNWIYGMVGYSGFVGEVNGERHKFSQGLYRFKVELTANGLPEVTKLEFLRSTNNNSWGVAFNEAGELFGSTANGCPLVHLAIPNRYYEKVRGLTPRALPNIALDNHIEPVVKEYRQVDWHGGFTAGAGCAIYTARTYPKEYWNRVAFVSEPTAHLTAAFVLQPNGTDYVARYGWNLLAGRDDWQAPIDAQVGPDGQMWVIDWYNIIVQHNPTPQGYRTGRGNAYETPLRDKKFGRVYRIVYTKAKPEPRVDLKDATPEKLVETLTHHNMGWRLHAQRLLVERGKTDVAGALLKLLDDQSTDETGLNAGAVHAAWTLAALTGLKDEREVKQIDTALKHPSAAVRRAGAMLSVNRTFQPKLLNDPDKRVVLAALLAAAAWDTDTAQSIGSELAKAAHLALTSDSQIEQAYRIAAGVHADSFLQAALAMKPSTSPRWYTLIEQVARGHAERGPATVGALLEAAAQSDLPSASAVVAGLSAGWPTGKRVDLPAKTGNSVAALLSKLPAASRGSLIKLASTMGVSGLESQLAEITQGLLATVADADRSSRVRLEAARQIVEFQPESDEAARQLVAAAKGASSEFATGLFDALAQSRAKGIGPMIVSSLKDLPPTVRPAALRVVLARAESVAAFLDAVEQGEVRFDALALDQRTALAAHPEKSIAERAQKLLAQGGGLPDADRQKVIDELRPILAKTGDVGLGKKAFLEHCAKCHKHGGEGQQIGPDLTGFAVHPKEEILIHILDPSRSVEGNYKAYTAQLFDGRVITGLLASETRTSIELLDAENKRHAINRDDIEELQESAKSLMPEGFEKTMTVDELTNLLEFMTQKGKYVPIPLDKYATTISTKGMFFDDAGRAERLVFPDWSPKEFKGVPFYLVDPQGDTAKNVILLYGPQGSKAPSMPKSVTVPCNTAAKAIHLLSGIGGWNYPASERGSVSLTVRLHYEDGKTENHELRNGVHFADYIRRVDVPGSEFAFRMRGGQQVRYLNVTPKRDAVIRNIEFAKGPDDTAPLIVAVTVETP
jgi:putative membrane-bound dehydrogenase-like protein